MLRQWMEQPMESLRGSEPNPLRASLTFDQWAICLPRWIFPRDGLAGLCVLDSSEL